MTSNYYDGERFNDAMDGRYGYWLVEGMVDSEWVLASSAIQAIQTSKVPEWQNPTARFVGRKPESHD